VPHGMLELTIKKSANLKAHNAVTWTIAPAIQGDQEAIRLVLCSRVHVLGRISGDIGKGLALLELIVDQEPNAAAPHFARDAALAPEISCFPRH